MMTEKKERHIWIAVTACMVVLLIGAAVYIGYRYLVSTHVYNGTFVMTESGGWPWIFM